LACLTTIQTKITKESILIFLGNHGKLIVILLLSLYVFVNVTYQLAYRQATHQIAASICAEQGAVEYKVAEGRIYCVAERERTLVRIY
jgi:hypothetical protein